MIENTKECKICHKLLSADYEGDVCPHCQEEDLFMRVKDYIRSNVVNEYMVADHFQISIKKVRNWIKEGRIEYVEKIHRSSAPNASVVASRFLSEHSVRIVCAS